jgi:SpoVK/Ycf46/Vps4 family AAA+-type ATPase
LPDAAARKSILDILLLKEGHKLDIPMEEVVGRTEYFSGRDLERLANQAVNAMVEDLNGEVPQLVDKGRKSIEEYELKVRPLRNADFDAAFQRIRVDVERYKQLEAKFREFAASN